MDFREALRVAASPADVWAVVVDPTSLAACIPGVHELRRIDDRTFEGVVSAAVGPIEGRFSFVALLVDPVPAERLAVEVRGSDSVTRSRLEADVEVALAPADGGSATTLAYRATMRVHGRLAILGEMVLRATAAAMIGQVIGCLRAGLEGEGGAAG